MDPKLTLETASWLETQRGIPTEIAEQFGVVTMTSRDGKSKAPAFEYRSKGQLQYRKYRITEADGGKRFQRDRKEAKTCMFLEHTIESNADVSQPLVICEGEIDALSLKAAGLRNVVSVPDGAQLSEIGEGVIDPSKDTAFGWLWDGDKLKPHIAQFNRFILATDADDKGRVLREELAVRLDRIKCDFVVYHDGCKDSNDVLVKHGPQALFTCITKSKPMNPSRLVRFGDLPRIGYGEVYSSGFKGLDDGLAFGMVIPELMIVTGDPGSGKSEWTTVLGAHLAKQGLPGAILQFEDRSQRVEDALRTYASNHIEGCNSPDKVEEWINQWFYTIEPDVNLNDDEDYTIEWLNGTLREARIRHGCRWVIIDPWNEVEHLWDRGQSEAIYTNNALRKLKRLSRSLQIILIVVTHPSKGGGQKKEISEMDLYDVSGSSAWNNKADHGIIVYRPDKEKNQVFVKVCKSKDQVMMGKRGVCRMEYQPSTGYRYIGMGDGISSVAVRYDNERPFE